MAPDVFSEQSLRHCGIDADHEHFFQVYILIIMEALSLEIIPIATSMLHSLVMKMKSSTS